MSHPILANHVRDGLIRPLNFNNQGLRVQLGAYLSVPACLQAARDERNIPLALHPLPSRIRPPPPQHPP